MAARTRRIQHTDEVRKRIQTSQLVNRLTSHALGKVKMEATQVQAARVLLAKALPDLQSVQLSSDPDNPLRTAVDLTGVSNDAITQLAAALGVSRSG